MDFDYLNTDLSINEPAQSHKEQSKQPTLAMLIKYMITLWLI